MSSKAGSPDDLPHRQVRSNEFSLCNTIGRSSSESPGNPRNVNQFSKVRRCSHITTMRGKVGRTPHMGCSYKMESATNAPMDNYAFAALPLEYPKGFHAEATWWAWIFCWISLWICARGRPHPMPRRSPLCCIASRVGPFWWMQNQRSSLHYIDLYTDAVLYRTF